MKPERVGGVKCFTRLLDWNTTGENLQADTTDISITCSLGMGAASQKTYGKKVCGVDAATQLERP